jgi:hypothetical protein
MKAIIQTLTFLLVLAAANVAHAQEYWRPRKTIVDHLYGCGVIKPTAENFAIVRPTGVVRVSSVTQTTTVRPVKFLGGFGLVEHQTTVVNGTSTPYPPSYYTYTSRPSTSVTIHVGSKRCR